MSVMLQTPSRASTASSSSFQPISRQNTMSSYDGSRSARQSKRYSMSALYMSMSANESDLVIEDDLAKGAPSCTRDRLIRAHNIDCTHSTKGSAGPQVQDLVAVQEELCPREGCSLPGLAHRPADPEPHGFGRGMSSRVQCVCHTDSRASKTKSQVILKTPPRCRRVPFRTTTRHKNTGT